MNMKKDTSVTVGNGTTNKPSLEIVHQNPPTWLKAPNSSNCHSYRYINGRRVSFDQTSGAATISPSSALAHGSSIDAPSRSGRCTHSDSRVQRGHLYSCNGLDCGNCLVDDRATSVCKACMADDYSFMSYQSMNSEWDFLQQSLPRQKASQPHHSQFEWTNMNGDMPSVDLLLARLAEVEAEKQQLESQLSPVLDRSTVGRTRKQTSCQQHLRTKSWAGSISTIKSSQPSTPNRNSSSKLKMSIRSNSSQTKQSFSPLLSFLVEYERYVPMFDGIYRQLDIKDVLNISRTCKKLEKFYHNMIPSKWNINRRLARFVNDPKEFRTRLGIADALISGTFALLFFAQLYWLDSGLDIYVRQGLKADDLMRYIGEDMQYEFDYSYGWSDDDDQRTLTKVLIFHRRGPPASPQIRFHLTRTSPLHSIVADCAFSTAHVNVIAWNKAYCMFPHTTFVNRRMFFLHNPDEALGQILSKYSAHGWRSSDWVDYDQTKGCLQPGIRENTRRIGDSSTWVMPLNLDRVKAPSTPDSVLENCTFQIYADQGPRESGHALVGLKTFSIGARTFECCMLKHSYTFHTPDSGWVVFLRNKLSRMSMLEILKTGDPDLQARIRQADFNIDDHRHCPLLQIMPRFCRPEGWEYADHLIPMWFAEWKESRKNIVEDLRPHPLSVTRSRIQQKRKPEPLDMTKIPPRTSSLSSATIRTPVSARPQQALPTPPVSSKSDCFPMLRHSREVRNSNTQQRPLVNRPQRSKSDYSGLPYPITKALPPLPTHQNQVQPPATKGNTLPRLQKPTKISAASLPWPNHALPLQTDVSRLDLKSQIPMPTIPLRHNETYITPHHRRVSSLSLIPTQDYFSLSHSRPDAPIPPPLRLRRTPIKDSDPLHPDLLTPPLDVPPPVPPRHLSRTFRSSRFQNTPLSPLNQQFQAVKLKERSVSEYSGDTAVHDVQEYSNFI